MALELGICPASMPNEFEGLNRGLNGGRICWAIAGTLCKGEVTGSRAVEIATCIECEFLHLVQNDEGSNFILIPTEKDLILQQKPPQIRRK